MDTVHDGGVFCDADGWSPENPISVALFLSIPSTWMKLPNFPGTGGFQMPRREGDIC
jgi:hypothetical protein